MITEFPLLVFTVLTGIAAGAYVGAALFPKKGEDAHAWVFPLVALILVVVGGLSAMTHLGRPALMLNVLNNPTSSLAMEGMSSGVLALVAIVDLVLAKRAGSANRAVRIVGALVGIVCMCIVTSAYVTSYGNVAWIAAPTWPLFALGDLAAGFGLWMALRGEPDNALATATAIVSILFAAVLAWQAVTFNGLGAAGVACIGVGAVLAAVAAVVAFMARSGKMAPRTTALLVAAIVIVALIMSRYGFYMASII